NHHAGLPAPNGVSHVAIFAAMPSSNPGVASHICDPAHTVQAGATSPIFGHPKNAEPIQRHIA
ncbi:MAG: hypothetical protein KBG15_09750, partial [Kofleriaceae bacterium]|nr:hypothetical protein [Kofleriaceae bacterium]